MNQKRLFMKHRATEQQRNQIVTATTDVTKMGSDLSVFCLNSSLFLLSCSVAQCFKFAFYRMNDYFRRHSTHNTRYMMCQIVSSCINMLLVVSVVWDQQVLFACSMSHLASIAPNPCTPAGKIRIFAL